MATIIKKTIETKTTQLESSINTTNILSFDQQENRWASESIGFDSGFKRRIFYLAQIHEEEGFIDVVSNVANQNLTSTRNVLEQNLLSKILSQPVLSSSGDIAPQEKTDIRANIMVNKIPMLRWPAQADPFLTNRIFDLLEKLWAIVVSRATQLYFPLKDTVVTVFMDTSENRKKAVLRVVCLANISQALSFWDSLEPDLQNWLNKLSDYERITFLTKISMRIYWR